MYNTVLDHLKVSTMLGRAIQVCATLCWATRLVKAVLGYRDLCNACARTPRLVNAVLGHPGLCNAVLGHPQVCATVCWATQI